MTYRRRDRYFLDPFNDQVYDRITGGVLHEGDHDDCERIWRNANDELYAPFDPDNLGFEKVE